MCPGVSGVSLGIDHEHFGLIDGLIHPQACSVLILSGDDEEQIESCLL